MTPTNVFLLSRIEYRILKGTNIHLTGGGERGVHGYGLVEENSVGSITRRDEQARSTSPGRDTLGDAEEDIVLY